MRIRPVSFPGAVRLVLSEIGHYDAARLAFSNPWA